MEISVNSSRWGRWWGAGARVSKYSAHPYPNRASQGQAEATAALPFVVLTPLHRKNLKSCLLRKTNHFSPDLQPATCCPQEPSKCKVATGWPKLHQPTGCQLPSTFIHPLTLLQSIPKWTRLPAWSREPPFRVPGFQSGFQNK